MNHTVCPRCSQDLCEDCFNQALLSITPGNVVPVVRKDIMAQSLDDYLERRRVPMISREHYKYGGMGAY